MAAEISATTTGERPAASSNVKLIIAAALLLLLAIAGGALMVRFAAGEWQRELRAWQVRLGIVADSRFVAIDEWLDRQFEEIAGLADNASLQIYVTQGSPCLMGTARSWRRPRACRRWPGGFANS
jgi:hypothetical protein